MLVLPESLLWTSITFAALLVISNLARKLGPMTVNGAESTWWLTLPVDRRPPMVLPPFVRKVALTAAGSAIIYLPFSMVTADDRAPLEHVLASLTFGAAGAIAVVLAAVQQLGLLGPPAWQDDCGHCTSCVLRPSSVAFLPVANSAGVSRRRRTLCRGGATRRSGAGG